MANAGQPLEFPEIVAAYPGRVNSFRFLLKCGLVENVTVGYTGAPGEVYDGPPAAAIRADGGGA